MRRRTAVIVLSAVALSSGLVGIAPPAAAATYTVTDLHLAAFRDIVVDEAHGHVFVSGGAGDGIIVLTLEGDPVTTITNQPGAAQMALSEDGTRLYAALSYGDAVSAIDTTTLTEAARYPTGASTCPSTVAVTAAKVWFGYACEGSGRLGAIDPAVQPATVETWNTPFWSGAPVLDASPAKPGVLIAGERSVSPAMLHVVDVSGQAPALGASRSMSAGMSDWALTPDGSHVIVASGGSFHDVLKTADLSADGVYGGGDVYYSNAVAVTEDLVVAGFRAVSDKDVYLYRRDGSLVRDYELGGPTRENGTLNAAGLAVTLGGTRVFAVTGGGRYDEPPVRLHVMRPFSREASSLTLNAPPQVDKNKLFTLTGQLSSAEPVQEGSVVAVERESESGAIALYSRKTAADGSFTILDVVSERGTYTYRASWAGDSDHAATSATATVRAYGLPGVLSITTAAGPYDYGARLLVTAHLSRPTSGVVSLYAQPYGGAKSLLRSGTIDSLGDLSAPYTMTRRTTFVASFPGDHTYEPVEVTKVLVARAKVTGAMVGHYAWSGGYRLFREGSRPTVPVTVAPNNAGACVDVVAQVYSAGAWRNSSAVSCSRLQSDSRTAATFSWNARAGYRFRVRPVFKGSLSNVATNGLWQYGRYTL